MAPKVDVNDPAVKSLLELFATISLTGPKALETVKNKKFSNAIADAIKSNGLSDKGLDTKSSALVVTAATSCADLEPTKRDYVIQRVLDGSLKTTDQINTASKYVANLPGQPEANEFDVECGVEEAGDGLHGIHEPYLILAGVEVTAEQCREEVDKFIAANKAEIDDAGGWAKLSTIITAVKTNPTMRWAAPSDIKNGAEAALLEAYGPRKAAVPKEKTKKPAVPAKEAQAAAPPTNVRPDAMFQEGFLSQLHKPGENPQIKPELRDQHLAATGGRVITRFPPEPNGFLHIGHSKAIAINFGYARYHGGLTYLRYDDTNPEAEEKQYFDSILEMVRWLGFEPFKVTYSSDYFQKLYDLAVELIKRDKAYVDHSTPEEIKAGRGGPERGPRKASKWRNRPIEESLREFENMKDGKYKPGQVTLRMKQDLEGSGNPQMWDLIAYRVLEAPHHRTGTTWCIYPTYDFTHCLVDSFENISHSLCTNEFILSRESYDWLCDALEVYKPRQSEYGRLDLEGTVMSKRKILKLVKDGYIKDWDDPRLYTLIALRRRGVPPGAILFFVNSLGVTTSKSTIQINRFEQAVRQYLESSTPRLMMVLNPVKVTIENLPVDFYLELEKPLHPKVPAMGNNKIPFTRTVYIDSSDFRTEDSKDYFRLAPGKTVGLLQVPQPITCTSYKTDPATGQVSEVICRYEEGSTLKPKAYIQWVAEHAPSGSPVKVDEARIFHPLFTSDNPAGEANYLDHINPDSLEVVKGAMLEVGFWDVAKTSIKQAKAEAEERTKKAKADAEKASKETLTVSCSSSAGSGAPEVTVEQLLGKECVRFQGMRVAYFALDKECSDLGLFDDAKSGEERRIILNRIVSLKEDTKKESGGSNAKISPPASSKK
ncbi:putative glutamine-tRNA ligase [Violaceomyces palustris]|uniref:Glutamine-tRNA ligase n=1 Tax=Violaceomyces palustris TaxID=1673888 RepID=A0ACD0P732_9BASI|nr:putative glutamine-tRNA ligase [Violaceomyces palustris]